MSLLFKAHSIERYRHGIHITSTHLVRQSETFPHFKFSVYKSVRTTMHKTYNFEMYTIQANQFHINHLI